MTDDKDEIANLDGAPSPAPQRVMDGKRKGREEDVRVDENTTVTRLVERGALCRTLGFQLPGYLRV